MSPDSEPPYSGAKDVIHAISVGNVGARKNPEDAQSTVLIPSGKGEEAKIIHTRARPEVSIRGFLYPALSTTEPQTKRPTPISPQNKPTAKPASMTPDPKSSRMNANQFSREQEQYRKMEKVDISPALSRDY